MSDSVWPCELQHSMFPILSLPPWVYSNSCPLSQWYYPTILSSVAPLSCCPQSFPASELIPVSQLFASGGQSIGPSASAPVIPMNFQGWFPLGLTSLISLLSKGLWKSPSTPQFKSMNSSALSFLYGPALTSIQDYWKKNIALIRWIFVGKVISLHFNMLSRLVIAFLPRSKHLLISWLQSPSAVIFGA